jgi:phenylacetate-coenzyme A ligase PaaK-like adenylate-forming protein
MHAMLPPFDPWRTGAAMLAVAQGTLASPNELARLRARRLADLLAAARRSPFFKAVIGERPPAGLQLADLPITRKAQLMQRFGEWLTVPGVSLDEVRAFMADPGNIGRPFMGRFMVWESSGSHGEPGIFIQDAAALAVYDGLEFLRRSMPRPARSMFDPWSVAEHKVFIGAVDGHFASTVSIERLRRWNPLMARTMHSLSFMQPIACLNAQLHDIDPAVIATYPSVAVMLAEEHLAGRLRIAPREVWTGGETLTPGMRSLITEAFDCAVVNSYGASEFMSLGWQCQHGSLHLNSDWAVLEAVDEDGRPVAPGTAGATTLLTNLANHVQPIIRYDLGDRVAVHDAPCPCGTHLPVISVEGRSGDVLLLGDKVKGEAKVSSLALSSVLEAIEGLPDFQLIQQAPDELELRTELQTPAIDAILRQARLALQDFIRRQGASGVHIQCHGGRQSRRTRNGKVQRVIALRPCHQQ